MLTLQSSTFHALNQIQFETFKSELKAFLHKHYSRELTQLGETQTDVFIAHVVDTAFDYGYHTQRPIYYLASLMMLFGSHCHKDHQLPWIHTLLTDYSIESGLTRMETLWHYARQYLSEVSGDNNQFLIKAFLQVRRLNYDNLDALTEASHPSFIHSTLEKIYPQKYHYQGAASIDVLIAHTKDICQTYEMSSLSSQSFLLGMFFLMGSHSVNDPLYPWFAQTLVQSELTEQVRIETLRAHALRYIDAALVAEA